MTLQEAIDHLQQILAEDKFGCKDCKKEHQQLLGWLLELKELRQGQRMTDLEVMQNELKCVQRDDCCRLENECAKCDLVLPKEEIVRAYTHIIDMLKEDEPKWIRVQGYYARV